MALVLTTVAGAFLVLVNMNPAVTVLVEGFLLLAWTGLLLERFRLNRLATPRVCDSICSFARSFDCRAIDTWVIRAVYEVLQDYLASAGFPLRATDRMSDDLGLEDDDIEDLAQEIGQRSGRAMEDTECNPLYGKVETVHDLVLFLAGQPRSEVSAG